MRTVDAQYGVRLLAIATDAVTGAADGLRTGFRSRPDVDYKEDRHDPVTAYDRSAEERIRDTIFAGEPDSLIVGEEEGVTGTGAVRWYVDPIDGTSNFVHGLAFFCSSVAATVDGRVVAAAVYDPLQDDLFTASPAGAWHNGTRLTSTGATAEPAALLLSGYPSPRHLAEDRDRALARFDTLVRTYATVRRVGSTVLALAYVAAGWADVALGLNVSPWDLAAASLLVTQAGGHFAGLRTGDGTEPPWYGPGYVATTGSLPSPSTVYSVFADTHRPVRG